MNIKWTGYPWEARHLAMFVIRTPNPPACEYGSGPSKDKRTNSIWYGIGRAVYMDHHL
jgi:hypothetical protein